MRKSLGSRHIKVEGRENKKDSADVTINGVQLILAEIEINHRHQQDID